MPNPKKSLVLLSGGQDSATCLAISLQNGPVHTIAFDYGQRHKIELEYAEKLAKEAGVPFEIIAIPTIAQLTSNALTHHDQIIEAKPGELPSTFVDGRNMIFLTFAAVKAKQLGIRTLVTGVCQTDFSGYPDCRNVFVKSLNVTLNLAMEYEFVIETPLMWLTKAETVRVMARLNCLSWYALTHTCYEGQRPPCGQCPACKLRAGGFAEAGIPDPLLTP